jgi:hypothetical protein
MPVFAFTVGSMGDFLSLGELIIKLGVALYTPGEAAKDYDELRREIELILKALEKISICKGQRMSAIAKRCLRLVQISVEECQKAIQNFLDKRSPPSQGLWNKLSWAVQGPSETAELRQRLSVHRENLNLLLEM